VIKYTANACRPFFLLHHLLRPRKRYRIPAFSPALFRPGTARRIPRTIWQTNYSDEVTLAVYVAYWFNRLISPTFEHRFSGDAECERFISLNFSAEIADAYRSLQIGAGKADYWRVLVLLKHGGVYLDMDANFVWPPEWFIEEDSDEMFLMDGGGLITNYFLASSPANPLFARFEEVIRNNIRENTLQSVFSMTGPMVFQSVLEDEMVVKQVYKTVCHQGQFMNERLQYPDKNNRKWWREESEKSILR